MAGEKEGWNTAYGTSEPQVFSWDHVIAFLFLLLLITLLLNDCIE